MVRKWLSVFFTLFVCTLAFVHYTEPVHASDDGYLYWGEVQSGVYRELHPYTLNWSGDVLEKGGINLTTLKMTTQPDEADIVINQYGSIGARGMVKLQNEQLEDQTFRYQQGFMNSFSLAQGDLYLIVLHDGKHAKLRIDRVLPGEVSFRYVLEADPPASTPPSASAPAAVPGDGAGSLPFPNNLFATWEVYPFGSAPVSKAGGISIFADGSYVHRWVNKGEKKGKWRLAQAGEVRNHTQAIILENGFENTNWAVAMDSQQNVVMYRSYVESPGGLYGGMKIGWQESLTGRKLSADPAQIAAVPISDAAYDYTVYHGSWNLWIEGGATNWYYSDTGNYATSTFTPGADGGKMTIHPDGTYSLQTGTISQTGTWRAAGFQEVYGYEGGIILEIGDGNHAWAVYATPSGKIVVAADSGAKWSDGSTMWIASFVAYK